MDVDKFENIHNSVNKLGTSEDNVKNNYFILNYDLFSSWNSNYNPYKDEINNSDMSEEGKDKKIKEISDNVMNAYDQILKLYNCSLHERMNKLVEQAGEKGKEQHFNDIKKQLDHDLSEINYDTDKNTIINLGKDVIKKLNNLPMELSELSYPSAELAHNLCYYYGDVYNYRNRKLDKNLDFNVTNGLMSS